MNHILSLISSKFYFIWVEWSGRQVWFLTRNWNKNSLPPAFWVMLLVIYQKSTSKPLLTVMTIIIFVYILYFWILKHPLYPLLRAKCTLPHSLPLLWLMGFLIGKPLPGQKMCVCVCVFVHVCTCTRSCACVLLWLQFRSQRYKWLLDCPLLCIIHTSPLH